MDERIHGYVVKYALTQGIIECGGRLAGEGRYVSVDRGSGYSMFLRRGREFFERREDAEAAARALANRRIASLRKSIVQMEKLAEHPKWRKD